MEDTLNRNNSISKYHLFEALLSYCNTPEESKLINDMMINDSSELDFVLALSDGIRYGNWPWTQHSLPKSFKGSE